MPMHVRVVGLAGLASLEAPQSAPDRMTEKSAVTPSARSVQMKKNAQLDLAMLLPTPTPFPIVRMTGTANPRSDPRRMTT